MPMRWSYGMTLPVAFAALACSAACSSQTAAPAPTAAATPARHPISGLEVIPLSIGQNGKTHAFRVEVAATMEQQQKGLMFRTAMGPDEGMLFPYDQPHVLSFWMRNTVLSLDLVFIDEQRRIINIAENAVPYSEESILSDAPAVAVLELNGGRARELGIVAGNKVDW